MPGRIVMSLTGAALAAAMVLATPAGAEVPRKDGHPDLSGFYNFTRIDEEAPAAKALIAKVPEGAVFMKDGGAYEFPPNEYGGLKPKPDVLAEARKWSPQQELEVQNICKKPSIIYAIQGPFPMEITQGRDMIVMQMEYFDMVRVIFMDGRDHPPADAPHSLLGHSIGHWEGDELVVDTTHLEPATITNNGLNHSEDAHFIERFRLSDDGQTLYSTEYIEDPTNLENTGYRLMAWKKHPGEHIFPYECDPFAYQEDE